MWMYTCTALAAYHNDEAIRPLCQADNRCLRREGFVRHSGPDFRQEGGALVVEHVKQRHLAGRMSMS